MTLGNLPKTYWLLFAGGKVDAPVKLYAPVDWQAIVDHFAGRIQFVQAGSAADATNIQPKLRGVIDMVGQTGVRDYFRLVAGAAGGVSGVTSAVHVAAGLDIPWIVLAGARERPAISRYPGHHYLETDAECGGCWKMRVAPLDTSLPWSNHNDHLCLKPAEGYAGCMRDITPGRVISIIEQILSKTRRPQPLDKIAFCCITDGRRPDITRVALRSLLAAAANSPIPCEVIVSGNVEPFADIPGIVAVPAQADAANGLLGALRNAGFDAAFARGASAAIAVDDDILVGPVFVNRFCAFDAVVDWEVMGVRLRWSNGSDMFGKKLDDIPHPRECFGIPGAFTALRRSIFEQFRWNPTIPYYVSRQGTGKINEDVEFSNRLRDAGKEVQFDVKNTAWHYRSTLKRMHPEFENIWQNSTLSTKKTVGLPIIYESRKPAFS